MASVIKRNRNGHISYLIQFMHKKKHKSICLSSDYTEKYARQFGGIIDDLVANDETGIAPPKQVVAWVRDAPQAIKDKLIKVGLLDQSRDYTLEELYNLHVRACERTMSPKTMETKKCFWRYAIQFVDKGERLSIMDSRYMQTITEDVYHAIGLSDATKNGVLRFFKTLFNWAVKNDIIERSPMRMIKVSDYKNKDREYYVTIDEYNQIYRATHDVEIRLALALYRFGGLRRAEPLNLTRDCFDETKFKVYSSKTKKFRYVPFFKEIREAYEQIPEDQEKLFVRHNHPESLSKAIERARDLAGVEKYPRIVQNLRSSRSNEIYRKFGAIAEKEWIGHSPTVALDHYLHALDDEFTRAIAED